MTWLNEKRVAGYARLIVLLNVVAIVVVLALSPHMIDPAGKPVGTDFIGIYAAGRMALEGHATEAYDPQKHQAAEQVALPWRAGQQAPLLPWVYPPMFLFVAAALAALPYGAALAVWLGLTLVMYAAVIRRIVPHRIAVWAGLAFPAVLLNLAHGQTGFLTTALFGGGLLLLDERPWIAGILFGLLTYKPQFAALIPLGLLAGGQGRALASAALTSAAAVAVSWAVWGGDAWRAFLAALGGMRTHGIEGGEISLEKLQSVFAATRMAGGSVALSYTAQAVVAIAMAAIVIGVWRSTRTPALRAAALAAGTLLATPYVFDYDLVLLAIPIASISALAIREDFLPWEQPILLVAWLLPLISRTIGAYLHVPIAPVVLALVMVIILRRVFPRRVY